MDAPSVAEWRAAIMSRFGPDNYTMRLLLLALSVLMEAEETLRLRATREDLAEATNLSTHWVTVVAKEANDAGWLRRTRLAGFGRAHRAYAYSPAIPVRHVNAQVPHGTSLALGVSLPLVT